MRHASEPRRKSAGKAGRSTIELDAAIHKCPRHHTCDFGDQFDRAAA